MICSKCNDYKPSTKLIDGILICDECVKNGNKTDVHKE